jgi:hypothetical protein
MGCGASSSAEQTAQPTVTSPSARARPPTDSASRDPGQQGTDAHSVDKAQFADTLLAEAGELFDRLPSNEAAALLASLQTSESEFAQILQDGLSQRYDTSA